jgi:DNA-directed RNA polymerase omega subunit
MTPTAEAHPVPLETLKPSGVLRHNRFQLAAVAFLRAKQLQAGARPRVPWDGHKPVTLALREILADTVSWSVEDKARDA